MTVYLDDVFIEESPDKCIYNDYSGGRCDSLELYYKDNEVVRSLMLEKSMKAIVSNERVTTGDMYISDIQYSGNGIALRALSLPLSAFRESNRYWDSVSFKELISDTAKEMELGVTLAHELNVFYEDVTRIDSNPIKFLQDRLMLEGFQAKIKNNSIFVFNEKIQENNEPVDELSTDSFENEPEFSTSDAGLIYSINNRYEKARKIINTTSYSGIEGKNRVINMAVSSIGESERFCQGIMREANKNEFIGSGTVSGNVYLAGETIDIHDAPFKHEGLNYIYMVRNDFVNEKQKIFFRRPLNA